MTVAYGLNAPRPGNDDDVCKKVCKEISLRVPTVNEVGVEYLENHTAYPRGHTFISEHVISFENRIFLMSTVSENPLP